MFASWSTGVQKVQAVRPYNATRLSFRAERGILHFQLDTRRHVAVRPFIVAAEDASGLQRKGFSIRFVGLCFRAVNQTGIMLALQSLSTD